jgi:quercetin dioxygenase-like cupin family protein
MNRYAFFLPALVLSVTVGMPTASAEEAQAPAMTRKLLLEKQVQLGSASIKTNVIKVIFPQGFKTPLHTHEGPGPRYVVRGQVKIEENGEAKVYGPGEVFWETGHWMTAENVGQGEAEVVIVELVAPKQ